MMAIRSQHIGMINVAVENGVDGEQRNFLHAPLNKQCIKLYLT